MIKDDEYKDNNYFKWKLDNYIFKENNELFISFEYKYFMNFIEKNKIKNILKKDNLDENNRFTFKLVNLNEIDMENEFKLLSKKRASIDFNVIYLWDNKSKNKWFLFFPDYIMDNTENILLFRNDFVRLYIKGDEPLDIEIYDNKTQNIEVWAYVSDFPIHNKPWYMICIDL